MPSSRHRIGIFVTTLAASLAGATSQPGTAHAQDAAEKCSSAYEDAQRQRLKGEFIEAARAAQVCSQAECNSLIVQECIRLYEQLQQDTPSMVFSAHNGKGEELFDVKVQVDGQLVTERLDGRPIELNPGPHTFHFEAEGLPPVEAKHTARVGDRNRLLEIVLGKPEPQQTKPEPQPISTPVAPPPEPPKKKATIPVASWVLGGVGVLGLAGFGYFRLAATKDYNDYGRTCSPRCNPDDVDKIHSKFQLSYVSLGVGAAALGGAALLFVVTRDKQGSPDSQVGLVPTYDGAKAQWQAHF